MEGWNRHQTGPTCKACLRSLDERGSMITPNGHGPSLKNPQNLILKNGHLIKAHLNNGKSVHKHDHHKHLDLVKDSLCCFKQSSSDLKKPDETIDEDAESKDGLCCFKHQSRKEENENSQDYSCGLWSFKPQWLQKLANKKVFLAVFCLTSVLQGMYYTYFVSVLTTIEKLYQIQSKTTGLIMSATEVGQIGGALLLTYYGGHGHRPKWIACGMLVFAAASIFCATPHFMYRDVTRFSRPPISDSENSSTIALRELRTKLCQVKYSSTLKTMTSSSTESSPNSSFDGDLFDVTSLGIEGSLNASMYNRTYRSAHADDLRIRSLVSSREGLSSQTPEVEVVCSEKIREGIHTRTTNTVLVIFFASLLLIGIGATAVYTLGIPYIDDNVATRESPLYFGITIGVRIFGPVFGFLLGSFCTSIYVNFPFEATEISTDNPQWLGAWWLGVLIVGAALILTAFPMMAFPKKLPKPCVHPSPNHHVKDNGNVPDTGSSCQQCQQSSFYSRNEDMAKPSLKDFPSAIRRLLKNDILMYRTASSVLHILPIAGLYTFLPKYLESQFQLTATMANMISGVAGILVMGVGIFASGTFMRNFKPNARFVARWIALSALLYAVGMLILMIFGCPLNSYVGLNAGSMYEDTTQKICNETCNCRSGEFAPICTSEGVTYLSPCLAGCTEVSGSSYDKFTYKNCLCLGVNVTATNGFCPLQCDNLLPYIFVFALFVLVHSTSEVGSMLLTLRCVEPKDKAMALGLIAFAIGLFGNVPCPIIYGAVVDSACLFWEQDACGQNGACRLYDPSKFRAVFHGVTAVIMLLAFVVDLVVFCKAKNIVFQEDEEEYNEEESVPINNTTLSEPVESSCV